MLINTRFERTGHSGLTTCAKCCAEFNYTDGARSVEYATGRVNTLCDVCTCRLEQALQSAVEKVESDFMYEYDNYITAVNAFWNDETGELKLPVQVAS